MQLYKKPLKQNNAAQLSVISLLLINKSPLTPLWKRGEHPWIQYGIKFRNAPSFEKGGLGRIKSA